MTGPSAAPFRWFTDDLTLRDQSGCLRWTCTFAFHDAETRREDIALLKARSYTMTFVDQLHYVTKSLATEDAIRQPERLRDACRELQQAGIQAVPRFGYEDARDLLAAIGGIDGYLPHLDRAARMLAPHVAGYCLGKECFERFSPTEVIRLVRVLEPNRRPIAIHLGQDEWGPTGRESAWWDDVTASAGACPLALAFQYPHPRVEAGRGAFRADGQTVRRRTRELLDRLQPSGIEVLAAEHSYNGESLDEAFVTEAESIALGDACLEAGATGALNGCSPAAIARALGQAGAQPVPPPFPGASWPVSTPEAQGVSSEALGAIAASRLGHATLIRHGHEIRTWGRPGRQLTNWASTARTWVTVLWGVWLRQHELAWLERPVRDLPAPSAARFAPDVQLKHLLSYTSRSPVGQVWRYSSGDHWPLQHALLDELFGAPAADALRQHVFPVLAGPTFDARMQSDGTVRVYGSCRDQARLAYLFLRGGAWDGTRLLDAVFVRRALGGGPDGDGRPNRHEGMQVHLIRDGRAWELDLPGVPDGFLARDGGSSHGAIIGIPSLDLVLTYRSRHPAGAFLPDVCRAVTG